MCGAPAKTTKPIRIKPQTHQPDSEVAWARQLQSLSPQTGSVETTKQKQARFKPTAAESQRFLIFNSPSTHQKYNTQRMTRNRRPFPF
jgi:hypothetical protein